MILGWPLYWGHPFLCRFSGDSDENKTKRGPIQRDTYLKDIEDSALDKGCGFNFINVYGIQIGEYLLYYY